MNETKRVRVFERLEACESPPPRKTNGGMTIIVSNSSKKKRRVVQHEPEPKEYFTVYMAKSDDEDESSETLGMNEPLGQLHARKRAKDTEKQDEKLKEIDANATGVKGLNSPQQSVPKTPTSSDLNYYAQLHRQLESHDQEMQLLKKKIEKTDKMFHNMHLFLVNQFFHR